MNRKKRINRKKDNRQQVVLIDVLIGFLLVILIAFGYHIIAQVNLPTFSDLFAVQIDESICLDIIITQYTITFLIVSLLSLLSGNGEYIYWVDILEQKIISPKHLNFISMSIYAFIFMFAGSVVFVYNKVELVLIYFVVDVLLLVFLTFRMTSIFFGKQRLKNKLFKEITKEVKNYLEVSDKVLLADIEDKLQGTYENANKLTEKKEFGQIFETDFQLLIDISEMMKEKYDNDLAKLLYANISKILLLFQGDSDYIFNLLNEKYQLFKPTILCAHTREMLQSALYSYIERILSNGEYRLSQDYFIDGVYENLNKSYQFLLEQKESTAVISPNKEYHNYAGEILFQREECFGVQEYRLIEEQFKCVHKKMYRLSLLIYQNNAYLFFEIVSKYGMPMEIIKEIDLFGLLNQYSHLVIANECYKTIIKELPIFQFNRYIANYNEYRMTREISLKFGDDMYGEMIKKDVIKTAYDINDVFKKILNRVLLEKQDANVSMVFLDKINSDLLEIINVIHCHFEGKKDEAEKMPYSLILNEQTYDKLVYKVLIKDQEFLGLLNAISVQFVNNKEIVEKVDKIKMLFTQENNMKEYSV